MPARISSAFAFYSMFHNFWHNVLSLKPLKYHCQTSLSGNFRDNGNTVKRYEHRVMDVAPLTFLIDKQFVIAKGQWSSSGAGSHYTPLASFVPHA